MSASSAAHDLAAWDSAWASLAPDRFRLFTRDTPRTLFQFWHRCYFGDLLAALGDRCQTGRFVEVGSGRGTTSMYLASRGGDVTLVDYSPAALVRARENFAGEMLPPPHLVLADARSTGLQSESCDCVYNVGLLEHFDDPQPVLDEMLRVLKPGGLLFAVIIPPVSASRALLAYTLFAPWRLVRYLVPPRLRRLAKRILHRVPLPADSVVRSDLSAADYRRMLPEEAVAGFSCIPYNPYHQVYDHPAAERWILVPAYRLHRAIRTLFASPAAATSPRFACCLLLTCRKR
jgi:SAM-dependent methyltransferase